MYFASLICPCPAHHLSENFQVFRPTCSAQLSSPPRELWAQIIHGPRIWSGPSKTKTQPAQLTQPALCPPTSPPYLSSRRRRSPLAAAASPRPAASCDPFYAAAPSGDGGEARRAGALMVQASAVALRRLGRRRGGDPAAALLRCGVVPSSSSSSAPGTLLPLKQPVGDCGGCRRSFSSSAWLGPRLWRCLPRRQSAAAAATAWEAHHSTRWGRVALVAAWRRLRFSIPYFISGCVRMPECFTHGFAFRFVMLM